MKLAFSIPGPPVPLARARVFWDPRFGKYGSATPKDSAMYAKHVRWHAIAAKGRSRVWLPRLDDRYAITCRVFFADEKRRDLSNVIKAIEDACNEVLWRDDSQIVIIHAWKFTSSDEPRVELEVEVLDSEESTCDK